MTDKESRTMDIGQKILEIRKAEGLSQTEFAEKFHVTRQTVSNWEHGKNYPDMETLMRISDEYGITFDELIKKDRELIRSIDRSRRVARKSVIAFTEECNSLYNNRSNYGRSLAHQADAGISFEVLL